MLTIDMLRQNSALTGLTDTQLQAIAEMSKNDENTVIGTKIGALHGQYDTDILSISGIKKNDGEKSYDYAKRVLEDYKTKLGATSTLQAQLANAKKEVDTLKQKLADNSGDDALKQQLKDAKAQVTQLQTQLSENEVKYKSEKEKLEGAIKSTHVDYAFRAATAGLKFKSGITDSVKTVLLNAAKQEILAKGTPDFIDDGKGEKTLIFRGADGNILNNPKNNLNPYTVEELVRESNSVKDVLEAQRTVTGGGTSGGQGGQGGQGGGVLDFSGVKNQIEADKIIERHLLDNGLTRDSAEFAEQSMQLRNENGVANLPIR